MRSRGSPVMGHGSAAAVRRTNPAAARQPAPSPRARSPPTPGRLRGSEPRLIDRDRVPVDDVRPPRVRRSPRPCRPRRPHRSVDEARVRLAEFDLGEHRLDVLLEGVGRRLQSGQVHERLGRGTARHRRVAERDRQVGVAMSASPRRPRGYRAGRRSRGCWSRRRRVGRVPGVRDDRHGRLARGREESAGAPSVIWVASAPLPPKFSTTSALGCCSSNAVSSTPNTSVSEAAAKTVMVPAAGSAISVPEPLPPGPCEAAQPASTRVAAAAAANRMRKRPTSPM